MPKVALSQIALVKLFWFATEAERLRVGDLIIQATEAIIADREQSRDSAKWFRATWKDLNHYRDTALAGEPVIQIINSGAARE
jgi:hypothetical protein